MGGDISDSVLDRAACAGTADKTILAPVFTSPVATQATILKNHPARKGGSISSSKILTRKIHRGGRRGTQRKKAEEWKEFTKAEPRIGWKVGVGNRRDSCPLDARSGDRTSCLHTVSRGLESPASFATPAKNLFAKDRIG